jgi:2-polyprenyl-3-methyl-5-hydroxy-6-metoxy-1,4-benzoquinol methylase
MNKSLLISDSYLRLQVDLHQGPRGYGNSGRKHAGEVWAVAQAMNLQSMIDYGAGGGTLKQTLQRSGWEGPIVEYDPAIQGIDKPPMEPADLVTCTDVLEHIEPERLTAVLKHIHYLTKLAAFLVISTVPSSKELRDGRNAHLIVQPPNWWTTAVERVGFHTQSRFVRWNELGPSELVLWVTR